MHATVAQVRHEIVSLILVSHLRYWYGAPVTTRPGTLDAGGTVDAASPAIEAVELRREYGQGATAVVAVDGVSFTVAAGAMVCIMGKSGSGKSTLLRQLGLIDVPTSGTLRLEGADVAALD
ncbi:MAG: ATP-binding cassette domain-containing protein, partial [Acidimicrobiales bacterium]|nr:ATP-binding cassette domain-containing protein [Acidimicrobiales bacterium]